MSVIPVFFLTLLSLVSNRSVFFTLLLLSSSFEILAKTSPARMNWNRLIAKECLLQRLRTLRRRIRLLSLLLILFVLVLLISLLMLFFVIEFFFHLDGLVLKVLDLLHDLVVRLFLFEPNDSKGILRLSVLVEPVLLPRPFVIEDLTICFFLLSLSQSLSLRLFYLEFLQGLL